MVIIQTFEIQTNLIHTNWTISTTFFMRLMVVYSAVRLQCEASIVSMKYASEAQITLAVTMS